MRNNDGQQQSKPKLGAGHASAMWRAGLKEMANILPAFPDSIQPVEELGLAGTKLPGEVYDAKKESLERNKPHDMNMEPEMDMER